MAYAPPLLVTGPPRTALPFGLFSVLTFASPSDPHWQNGIEWEPVAGCLDVLGAVDEGCFDPTPDPVGFPIDFDGTDTGGLNAAPATPFTVYGRYRCSPVGRSLDYAQSRAQAALVAGEEHRVEQALWAGDLGNVGLITGAANLGTSVAPEVAIGLLEEWIADNYRSLGVIHVTRAGAITLSAAGVISDSTTGGVFRTKLGTPIVAGSGYTGTSPLDAAPAAGTSWAYVTPALLGYRSEPFPAADTPAGNFDRATNDLFALVGRTYAIGWDACSDPSTAGVNFDLEEES